jgi:hypothetical protein
MMFDSTQHITPHHRMLSLLLDDTEHHQVTVLHKHGLLWHLRIAQSLSSGVPLKVDWLTQLSNHHSTRHRLLFQLLDDTVDLLSDWN